MVLATNIEKSHPHGPQREYLCLASSPFSNQKIALPFLPSFLNHCPTVTLIHYLLRRSRGPVGAILQAGLWEDQSGVSVIKTTGSEEGRDIPFLSSFQLHPRGGTRKWRRVSEPHTDFCLPHYSFLLCHLGEGTPMWNPA